MAIPSKQIGWSQESNLIYELVKQISRLSQIIGSDVQKSFIVPNKTETATYTLIESDRGKIILMDLAAPGNLIVPTNTAVPFPIGTEILVSQKGSAAVTITGPGVTLRAANGDLKLAAQYSGASLLKVNTDEWYVFGDLTT